MANGLIKQFRISTRWSDRLRTVQVCIYDDVEAMREAGRKHARRYTPEITEGFDRAWGLSQAFESLAISKGGRTRRLPPAGYIRLVKGHLGTGLLAHECTHMAMAIYRHDVQRTVPDMEREEKLCYLVGDLTSRVVKALYKYNLFDE